ncbi:hypothetical protein AQUCO_08600055v1 [Aquilegia coerulea]|uniref:Pentacotripeptide-repeat region of PRORP domain-containing protein n=1 Tax=Aquilegia coerulea TaxID=218851 RepID=A0A2G5C6L1_AQUCA|nr:hypothetical protein AQUCO_08600055v1 [Aquilegia coerulea]
MDRLEIVHLIKQFRVFKRYKHALEISQWMSDRNYLVLSPGDVSVRLDLISKVNGIEQAEKYFDDIPTKLKTFPVYSALLNCYAQSKSVEKAEEVMQQMRELEIAMSPLAYNVLLNLYSQLGQYEKLDILMEEMEEKGVHPDKFTYSIRLSAYAATSDIDGMEKTFQRMSLDPEVDMDWSCYVIPANGYVKAGLNDKALGMLKQSEELITEKKKRVAYEFLLTMYAGAASKENLYRIWKLYKSSEKVYNKAYLCMIGSLLKLDDIAGAEKILEEWENGDTVYDSRVPNLLIAAYCKDGLLEKAERLVIDGIEKGNKPCPNTWEILATGYLKANQMPQAVKNLRAAYLATRPGWKPNRETLTSCLVYLKQQGDVKQAKELVKLLGAAGNLSTDICKKLQDYIYN